MKVKQAPFLIKYFLETTGFAAITMPWQTIYVLPEHMNNSGLIAHETVHVKQIQEFGAVKFTLKYLWYQIRYGYKNNPFEIEARAISGHS